tara:strand:+ start:14678 stop:15034 length:357 start_codon:yes stop_codon:yes gene_type:complete
MFFKTNNYLDFKKNTKMKKIESTLSNTRFIDYMFGLFNVLLSFGYFPRDYQENAVTIFVLFSLLVYELCKLLSHKIRTAVIIYAHSKLNEESNYRLNLPAIAGCMHLLFFIIFMVAIA